MWFKNHKERFRLCMPEGPPSLINKQGKLEPHESRDQRGMAEEDITEEVSTLDLKAGSSCTECHDVTILK